MSYRLYSSSRGKHVWHCVAHIMICSSYIHTVAHSGPDEPLAHPRQICADELSSIIAQALKTCADELPSITLKPGNMCTSSCMIAHVAYRWATLEKSYSSSCGALIRFVRGVETCDFSRHQFDKMPTIHIPTDASPYERTAVKRERRNVVLRTGVILRRGCRMTKIQAHSFLYGMQT